MTARRILFALVVINLPWASTAQAVRFAQFGDVWTEVTDIADYGGVFVGSQGLNGSFGDARRWTSTTQFTNLGPGSATGVSADGSAVSGTHVEYNGDNIEAFRWTAATGTDLLGRPEGEYSYSNGNAISPDGSVVAGAMTRVTADEVSFEYEDRAYLWPGGEVLPLPNGGSSGAHNYFTSISGNGVVAGYEIAAHDVSGPGARISPFIYYNHTIIGMGHLPGAYDLPSPQTFAWDISRDGKVVVGSGTNAQGKTEAFRYTIDTGMVGLGSLPGFTDSYAVATSADGSVIVGTAYNSADSNSTRSGFYWTATDGIRAADDVLQSAGADLAGYHISHVNSVSASGLNIVGDSENYSVFQFKAFVANLPQIVGLAWGKDVPVEYVAITDQTGNVIDIRNRAGTTPALAIDLATQADLKVRVREILALSGIDNVLIVDGEVEGATNVYFASPFGDGTAGEAFSGIDQFNQRAKGAIASFFNGNTEFFGRSIAHEIGHTVGLRHVNPGSALNPSEVMDYNFLAGRPERFLNIVSEITEPPKAGGAGRGIDHNPQFHFRRYVNGESLEELHALGIEPGEWDLLPNGGLARAADIDGSLDFGAFDTQLFNVYVLVGDGEDEEGIMEQLLYSPSLMVSQLSALNWDVKEGLQLSVVAASTDGGPLDVILASGDPFDDANFGVAAGLGNIAIQLQLITDPLTGAYTTLASGQFLGLTPVEGDYNRDGTVDAADYVVWRTSMGQMGSDLAADGHPNDQIDIFDYVVWRNHFGETRGGGASGSAVPEPSGTVLLLAGAMVMFRHRNRKGDTLHFRSLSVIPTIR